MKERLYGLELLRFIAAALVLFFHISVIGVGEFGVDIFFIISGFVMMYSTQIDSRNFLLKRLIRIVPLYWLVTLIIFLFYYIFPSFFSAPSNDLSHLVMSLLFIPFDKNGSGHAPILSVGWTLNYEMYFYFLFSLACIISNKNRGIVVVFLIVVIMFVLYFFDNFISSVYSDLIIIEFALGILLFYFLNKNVLKSFIIIFFIFFSVLLKFDLEHRFFLFGLPCFIIVFLFIKFNRKFFKTGIISLLGAISYGLYLSHYYIINLVERITNLIGVNNLFIQINSALMSLIGSIVISLILYKNFEKKILKLLRTNLL